MVIARLLFVQLVGQVSDVGSEALRPCLNVVDRPHVGDGAIQERFKIGREHVRRDLFHEPLRLRVGQSVRAFEDVFAVHLRSVARLDK